MCNIVAISAGEASNFRIKIVIAAIYWVWSFESKINGEPASKLAAKDQDRWMCGMHCETHQARPVSPHA
jgi:hypothetical protein